MFGSNFMIFLTVTSLIFAILAFLDKDIILDDAYIKASEDERKNMNTNS